MDELELQPAEHEEIPADEVGLDLAPRLRTGVGAAFLEDEGVLLDPATGSSHVLDSPAALVTRFLDGESTLAEIAFDISDVLGVDRGQVEADVLTLARTLGAHGLLDGVARDPHAGHEHRRSSEGVPVGADLSAWDGWAELADAAADSRTVVVNWGTRCGFCSAIVADLADLDPRLREAGTGLVLLTTGSEASLREQTGDLALPAVHLEEPPDFFTGLGTPVAYLVDRDRIVLQPLAVGSGEVPDLLRRLLGER